MEDIKRKPLLFFEKMFEVIFLTLVWFLLVLNALKESFEHTRFVRDIISLYTKAHSKKLKILSALKK